MSRARGVALGWFLAALVAWQGCSDDDAASDTRPVRSCTTVLSYEADGPVQSLYVAGDFNRWAEDSDRLTDPDGDGVYTIELSLGPGEYAYKFILNGEWILDPANPYRIWRDGFENSKLVVPDCRVPALQLLSSAGTWDAASGTGLVRVVVQYVDGADRYGPDPESFRLSVNREDRTDTLSFDEETWRIEVSLPVPEQDKYTLVFQASDRAGTRAEDLWVPVWVEEEPFSWEDAVIYFVFTDRFRNGDPTNDAPVPGVDPKANYWGGDFAGVLAALREGYFDDLGVTALWLSPPQENPSTGWPGADGRQYTGYHGYWPSKPRTPQPRFGTLDELRALTAEAHRRGIRVLADAVLNHVHSEHPYYQDHAGDGWFHGDGSCVCGREGCDWETHKIDCWFAEYTPDLNYENPAVVDQMVSDMLWWVREADLDGLRCDAVKHMRHVAVMTLAAKLNEVYDAAGVRFYLVGETFTGEDGRWEIARFLGPNELDGQFDFPLYWAMLDTFARFGRTLADLDRAVRDNEGFYPEGTIMSPFLGNHDVPRLFSHAAGDIADLWGNGSKEQGWSDPPGPADSDEPYRRVMLGFTFLLTMPGAPLIYYGDEIGLPGAGDPDNRRPMRFGDELSPRERMVLAHVQKLGRLRRRLRVLRRGDRRTVYVEDDFYVFARTDPETGQVALVAVNRQDRAWTGSVFLPAELGLADGAVLTDELGGGRVTVSGGAVRLDVPAMEGAVYVSE